GRDPFLEALLICFNTGLVWMLVLTLILVRREQGASSGRAYAAPSGGRHLRVPTPNGRRRGLVVGCSVHSPCGCAGTSTDRPQGPPAEGSPESHTDRPRRTLLQRRVGLVRARRDGGLPRALGRGAPLPRFLLPRMRIAF